MINSQWALATGGDWDTAADWSPVGLPGSAAAVSIATVQAATITHQTAQIDQVASLSLAAPDTLSLANGSLIVTGASALAGAVSLSGSTLEFDGMTTIAGAFQQTGGSLQGSGTVTLAGGAALSNAYQSGTGQTIVDGNSSASGTVTIAGSRTFENDGAFTIGGSARVTFNGNLTNTGTIEVQNGGWFRFESTFDNTGTVTIDGGGYVYLQGSLSGASLNNFVDNGGSLILQGSVTGGTVLQQPIAFLDGTFDGVTYDGTLDIETVPVYGNGALTIDGGLTVHGANGTGNGTIDIDTSSGAAEGLIFDNTQTIDNATINLGRAGANVSAITDSDTARIGGQVLTFGTNLTINFASGSIGRYGVNGTTAESIVNNGTINATTSTLAIDPERFTNNGSITVGGGATLYLEYVASPLANAWTNTGTIDVNAGGTLWLQGNGTNTGTITVGAGATVWLTGNWSNSGKIVLAAGGTAYIEGNPSAASLANIVNNGGAAIQAYTLTPDFDTINAPPGTDEIAAASGTLTPGDVINAGAGDTSTLGLQGGGTFDLALPTALTNIATVAATELTGQVQTITMRSGLNVTVNIASVPGGAIALVGANDADVFNLGGGTDTVTPGSAAETINGGGGTATIHAAAATAGVAIHGGSGATTLILNGGGTAVLNSADSGLQTVILSAAPRGQSQPAWNFTASATPGLSISDLSGAGDTIAPGAASQSVTTAAGNDVVLATAATAGARVTGGAGTVLEVQGGGSFAMNAATTGVTVQLDSASTLTLNQVHGIGVTGSSGGDTIIATNSLNNDSINPGGSGNTLVLQGAGTFALGQVAALTNIQTIDVSEGQLGYTPAGGTPLPATMQTVLLRDGLDAAVNVTSGTPAAGNPNPERVSIVGANDADTINLGAGADVVTLGSAAETVNGGSGNDTVNATAATAGATIHGGSGTMTLNLAGGGAVTLGSGVTGITSVVLNAAPAGQSQPAWDFTASAIAGLAITDRSGAGDTIVLGAASQSVRTAAGNDIVLATAATAGATVTGGAGTVLEVQGGGSFALGAATTGVTVQLDQASTVTLGRHGGIGVTGSSGGDTIIATGNLTGDTLSPGGSGNTLALQGGGTFNLNLAAAISNIQTIDVSEGQAAYTPAGGTTLPATAQLVDLRNGMNAVVNVASGVAAAGNPNVETITIIGGNDADTINLGEGTDTVTLGSAAESVAAGTGTARINATAATAGALITGNGTATAVNVAGGGTATLNAGNSGVTSVTLGASATAYDFTSNTQSGLTITDRSAAGDVISVGGANTTVIDGAGADTIAFHAGLGHAVVQGFTASGLQHDTVQFDSSVFADWAHVLGATRQQGSDLLITIDANDTLLLKHVSLASFTASDVKFV